MFAPTLLTPDGMCSTVGSSIRCVISKQQLLPAHGRRRGGFPEMWAHMQQEQSWQTIIIALGFIAFTGFVLWVTRDHNVSTIWAQVGIRIGAFTGVFLVATGMARNG